ncbi:MAG: hypothetical protein ACTSYX_12625 [Candidatus Thorarchaeota archaeon]
MPKIVLTFDPNAVRFPDICPVCGVRATKYVRLTITGSPDDLQFALHSYREFPEFSSGKTRRGTGQLRVLRLPVCEEHVYREDDSYRLRLVCVLMTIVAAAIAWIGLGEVFRNQQLGNPVPLWTFLAMGLFAVALVITRSAFRPSGIERAFRVTKVAPDLHEVTVQLTSREYADAFLHLNPSASIQKDS